MVILSFRAKKRTVPKTRRGNHIFRVDLEQRRFGVKAKVAPHGGCANKLLGQTGWQFWSSVLVAVRGGWFEGIETKAAVAKDIFIVMLVNLVELAIEMLALQAFVLAVCFEVRADNALLLAVCFEVRPDNALVSAVCFEVLANNALVRAVCFEVRADNAWLKAVCFEVLASNALVGAVCFECWS